MSEYLQLTLDGREVPHAEVVRGPTRVRPLTPAQQDILRFAVLNRKGWIRSVEAGRIVHTHRPGGGCLAMQYGWASRNIEKIGTWGKPIGCCKWAASDGNQACHRLQARGLLYRQEPGVWVTA